MEIELSKVIAYSKDCLQSRALMRSIMLDLYPGRTLEMNVLLCIYESGVPLEIKNNGNISEEQYKRYIKKIIDEYGLQEQYVIQGLNEWIKQCISAEKYNNLSFFKVDEKIALSLSNSVHVIEHAPIDYKVVNAKASDFELSDLPNGTVEIKKFLGFDEVRMIVPNMIEGKKVSGVGNNAYRACTTMKEVLLSEGIEYINDGAFAECVNLQIVKLPTTLRRLGSEIVKANKYGYISGTPIYNATLGMYNYTPQGVFSKCAITDIQFPVKLESIGKDAFYGCSKLVKIDLPNNIKRIGERCFYGCTELTTILLPDKLEGIGQHAFTRCAKLNSISFPNSLKIIEMGAFTSCGSLTNVRLNEGLLELGANSFQDCKSLQKILLPSTLEKIGSDLFVINGWYQPYDRRRNGHATKSINDKLTVFCYGGSKGLEYARKEGYRIENAVNY